MMMVLSLLLLFTHQITSFSLIIMSKFCLCLKASPWIFGLGRELETNTTLISVVEKPFVIFFVYASNEMLNHKLKIQPSYQAFFIELRRRATSRQPETLSSMGFAFAILQFFFRLPMKKWMLEEQNWNLRLTPFIAWFILSGPLFVVPAFLIK